MAKSDRRQDPSVLWVQDDANRAPLTPSDRIRRTNRLLLWAGLATVLFLIAAVIVAGALRGDPSASDVPATCAAFPLATADEYLRNADTGAVYVTGAKAKRAAAFPFERKLRSGNQYWAIAIDATVATAVVFHPGPTPDSLPTGLTLSADEASERLVHFPAADGTTLHSALLEAGAEPAAYNARSCFTP